MTTSLTNATPDGARAAVTGIARALDRTLHAPATGRTCLAFSVLVLAPNTQNLSNNFFDRVFAIFSPRPKISWNDDPQTYVELVPFAVEDAQLGKVIIDSQFADVRGFEKLQPKQLHDRHWTDFVDDRKIPPTSTGIEAAVLEGATVTVVGTVTRRQATPGAEAHYREAPAELCLVGDFDHPLVISRA